MVASKRIGLPCYRGLGRQLGRSLSELAEITGRKIFLVLRNEIAPAEKNVAVDWLKFAAPETAEVVSGKRILRRQQ